jgi:4-hydroxymandelate oxidase
MTTAPIPPVNLNEFENAARERLDPMVYDYYAGGSEDEITLRANRAAYERFMLRPRVLVDVSKLDLGVELFGDQLSLPVLLAPAAFQRLAHTDGEMASARAARTAGTLLVASTVSTHTVEQIAAAAAGPFWFQVYVFRDREITRAIVQRAEACGARAVCLTTSVPVQGKRERDTRSGFRLPPDVDIANFRGSEQAGFPETQGSGLEAFVKREFDPTLTWDAVEWLRSITSLPVLLKGVLAPEDAKLAVEHGVDGLIVSNHGGRQLDACIPTLLALPDVVDAVAGRIPVLVDGGIRRGTDVVKALALGAKAVLIGRPYLWGLAVGGQQGVEAVIEQLRTELLRAMALVGHTSLKTLDRTLLVKV